MRVAAPAERTTLGKPNRHHDWQLRGRATLSGRELAFDVWGSGPPVVLVHGTPSRSYLWRNVAPVLAETMTVHVYDLLGYGDSVAAEGQDISIAAQAHLLAQLIELWGLEEPAIAGHDIGGAITLRAHLLGDVPFERMALVDAVVLRPWITTTTRHMKTHLECYRTMPIHIFEQAATGHLRTAVHRSMDEQTFEAFFGQWRGPEGKRAYLQHVSQFDEEQTAEYEPLLVTMKTLVRLVWGEHDAWIDRSVAERINDILPSSDLRIIPEAGHFSMEDEPSAVAEALLSFFASHRS